MSDNLKDHTKKKNGFLTKTFTRIAAIFSIIKRIYIATIVFIIEFSIVLKDIFLTSFKILLVTAKKAWFSFRQKVKVKAVIFQVKRRSFLKHLKVQYYNVNKILTDNIPHFLLLLSLLTFILVIGFTCALYFSNQECKDIFWGLFKKNEYEKFAQKYKFPITLAGVGLALTTLFLTAKRINQTDRQLKLMEKQRAASMQPELFLTLPDFLIQNYVLPNSPYAFAAMRFEKGNSKAAYFELRNIGMGAAKNIRIKYSFDLLLCGLMINDYEEKVGWEVLLEYENETSIKIIIDGQEQIYKNEQDWMFEKYNFILPDSKTNEPLKCEIPSIYVSLLAIYLSLAYKFGEVDLKLSDFPSLDIEISYLDIENREHIRRFKVILKSDSFNSYLTDNNSFRQGPNRFSGEIFMWDRDLLLGYNHRRFNKMAHYLRKTKIITP